MKIPHRLIEHDGINIKSISKHKAQYCKTLFKAYKDKTFKFSTLNQRQVLVGKKNRIIYQYPLPDLIIHYCIAEEIRLKTEPLAIDHLFSYRKGKSSEKALKLVNKYIRAHKSNKKIKKEWGIFVIRKDITKFSDSIKTTEDSILWGELLPFIQHLNTYDKKIIHQSLKPYYIPFDDKEIKIPRQLEFIPMGSPITGHLTNFFLKDLDKKLSLNYDDLYIRFGDDILYLTEDSFKFQEVDEFINMFCKTRELTFSQSKSYSTFLTSSGSPPSQGIICDRHSTHFEYLGMKIDFNRGLTLTSEKYKKIFQEIRKILTHLKQNLSQFDHIDDQILTQHVVDEFNAWISPSSLKSMLYFDKIYGLIDNHKELKKIDLDLAKEVLNHIKNKKSKKNFRNHAYKKIRSDYKLFSVVKKKNERFK